jgi:hypothetical protein
MLYLKLFLNESAIKTSRGTVLTPFPILSVVLTIKASGHPLLTAKNGLLTVDSP